MQITSMPHHKICLNFSMSLSTAYDDKNSTCNGQVCKKKGSLPSPKAKFTVICSILHGH